MTDFRGLTWDHPRGRHALEAAATRIADGDTLRWDVQPLEGFESAPIGELAQRYDLLVLDHPHLGDALAGGSLQPIDELFDDSQVRAWRGAAVGPSVSSYLMDEHLWALPLDAATQVSARRTDLVPQAPSSWDEVEALAERGLVALSLAGPHAFLSLCSVAVSYGDDPGSAATGLFHRPTAERALALLARLARRVPDGSARLNPIGLLDRMREEGDIGLVPLVYGYVNYSSPSLVFGPAPAEGGRIGSTLGGTGIAVTARCDPTPGLLEHLAWLMDTTTQRTFVPQHDGQPGSRAAWTDPEVDATAHGFYSATLTTIESSWVRPRIPGYVPFQSAASAIVRSAVLGDRTLAGALDEIDERFATLREDQP